MVIQGDFHFESENKHVIDLASLNHNCYRYIQATINNKNFFDKFVIRIPDEDINTQFAVMKNLQKDFLVES